MTSLLHWTPPRSQMDDPYQTAAAEGWDVEIDATQQASQRPPEEGDDEQDWDSDSWATLVPKNSSQPYFRLPITKCSVTLGRHPAADCVVTGDARISAEHLELRWSDTGIFTICDKSTNGTWLENILLVKNEYTAIKRGQTIAIGQRGSNEYTFHSPLIETRHRAEDRYSALILIGTGGMGEVSKALDTKTGCVVAMKTIVITSENELHTRREVEVMRALSGHPFIVQILDNYDRPTVLRKEHRIIMELMAGGSLFDWNAENRFTIDEQMYQHFMYQIMKALEYIHSKGITHRDLKPENLLLTKSEPPVIKIADFGLSKHVKNNLTRFKTKGLGTVQFMAPEQLDDPEGNSTSYYDSKVDAWSVGIILFVLAAFQNAWIEQYDETQMKRVFDTFMETRLSNEAKSFWRRLVRVDPEERMSMKQALADPWLLDYADPKPVYRVGSHGLEGPLRQLHRFPPATLAHRPTPRYNDAGAVPSGTTVLTPDATARYRRPEQDDSFFYGTSTAGPSRVVEASGAGSEGVVAFQGYPSTPSGSATPSNGFFTATNTGGYTPGLSASSTNPSIPGLHLFKHMAPPQAIR
ncbi:kinase-like protein [Cylindrobasidium torrendii FP15055 ss-10]|uniref:Kinase-like protein n=1 Tax=Cylindrobasidium torrendii FP15055 ss-10 TaxID=1314674 RepID=A0A0D7BHN2_9AGAR|nr:kinase-like protein [Cylindrobasidium torrendii FP15055 ss-10]